MKNISLVIAVLIILFALSTIIIVDETEQIVILQFGKPVRTLKDPGLNWKLPAPFQEFVVPLLLCLFTDTVPLTGCLVRVRGAKH